MKLPWCTEKDKKEHEYTIGNMDIGNWGYITPWSVDEETRTVKLNAAVYPKRGGTVDLYIERISENQYRIHNEYGKIFTIKLSDKEKLDIAIEALENIVNMEKFYYNPYLYGLDTARKALKKLT